MSRTLCVWTLLAYISSFLNAEPCIRSEWHQYSGDHIYLKPFDTVKSFDEALMICQSLAVKGRLVTVHKGTKIDFIKSWMHEIYECGNVFYIGLRGHEKGDQHVLRWTDGKYLTWTEKEHLGENINSGCYTTEWCESKEWNVTDCTQENRFICEAFEPCSSSVRLTMNGKEESDDEHVLIINEQDIEISCRAIGYVDAIEQISLNCDGVNGPNKTTNESSLVLKIHVNLDMDKKLCVCKSQAIPGYMQEQLIRLFFKSSPRYINGGNNETNFELTTGETLPIVLQIFAKPLPTNYTLIKSTVVNSAVTHSTVVDRSVYYLVTREMAPYHMAVAIYIYALKPTDSGTYTLYINNGVGQHLEYSCTLKVLDHPKKSQAQGPNKTSFFIFIGVSVGLMASIALLAFWTGQSRTKGDEVAEEVVDESSQASSASGTKPTSNRASSEKAISIRSARSEISSDSHSSSSSKTSEDISKPVKASESVYSPSV